MRTVKMTKVKTMIILLSTLVLQANGSNFMQDSADSLKIAQLAEEVRAKYAPDKRTALFELTTSKDQPNTFHIETTIPEAKAEFDRLRSAAGLKAKVDVDLLPNSTVGDKTKGVVRLSVVDIRYTPANQAEMVTQAILGTPIDLLKKRGDYYLIRTPEGYIAWLKSASLTAMDPATFQNWKTSNKVMFTHDFGHSYSEADKNAQRVSDLVMGNLLELKGISGDFFEVAYPDGRQAFISKEQAIPYQDWLVQTELTAKNVLDVAKTMIGVPYLWGGTSVKGVDCSGFTKTSFFMSGLVIPRDASQQVNSGLEIDILTNNEIDRDKVLANLQPADLLFFAERKGQVENARVTHVALYLGNGEFIHASGLVRINSLFTDADNFDKHQASTIVAAKRYIGHLGNGLEAVSAHGAYAVN